jgi:hypothetical protein
MQSHEDIFSEDALTRTMHSLKVFHSNLHDVLPSSHLQTVALRYDNLDTN